jgi:hypothetical protein
MRVFIEIYCDYFVGFSGQMNRTVRKIVQGSAIRKGMVWRAISTEDNIPKMCQRPLELVNKGDIFHKTHGVRQQDHNSSYYT